MRKFGPTHIILLLIASVALGWLAAGCGPKDPKPTCTDTSTGRDCPVQGPIRQGDPAVVPG